MGKGIPKRYLHIVFLKNHLLGFPILRETGHFVQPLPRRSLRERLPATSSSSWRLGINPKLTGKYRKIIYITYIYIIYIHNYTIYIRIHEWESSLYIYIYRMGGFSSHYFSVFHRSVFQGVHLGRNRFRKDGWWNKPMT